MYEVGAIATIITSLALLGVGVMVGVSRIRNLRASTSGAGFFVVICFALALWLISNVLSDVDTSRALFWVRTSYASITTALLSLLLFVNRFPVARFASRTEITVHIGLLAVMLGLIASPLIVPRLTFEGGVATVVPGSLYWVFFIFVFYALGVSLVRLVQGVHLKKRHKVQVRLILTGVIITSAVALVTNLVLPLILGNNDLYWLASVSTLGFVVATALAIIKEGLFDVRHAVVRSVTYIVSLATIVSIYYIVVYLLSHVVLNNQKIADTVVSPLSIMPALLLTLLFQPVKAFFDKVTDKVFFKASYGSVEFIARLNGLLSSTTDLRGMLERVSNEIGMTLKSEQVFFYLRGEGEDNRHLSAGTERHSSLALYDVRLLDDYMLRAKSKDVFLVGMLGDDVKNVRRMLASHHVALVVPLRTSDNLIGYVFLGEHRSSSYTKRDLSVLATISHELVIAIQNALSLHEVQELNETLQQRINVATKELRSSNSQLKHLDEVKDEFMSMASHQLRTPLTSIKGYLSMVLEGDAGHISPQQRKLLEEAYKSSERMVGLIADFLNVSRLQTGKFVLDRTPFDFKDVVRQEVADLQLIANTHDIKLRAKLGVGAFPVVADEQKLRQVIMNLIDNAIYYSPPKSTVVVNLERIKNQAALTVVDPGIGVPEAEQSRLFNKFFRAHNARKQRPDGTGVGLYLARRVVTAHGGGIIFSSKENRGSTFGFRIPIDETAVIKPRRSQAAAAKTTK